MCENPGDIHSSNATGLSGGTRRSDGEYVPEAWPAVALECPNKQGGSLMKRVYLLGVAISICFAGWSAEQSKCRLALRSRVGSVRGNGQWREVRIDYPVDPARSALIVCDMWDKHWGTGANIRVAALAK